MGSGKTSAAITYINRSAPESHFVFLSPYVDEGKRIATACPERNFAVLEKRRGSKLNDLRYQVRQHRNIASTHALLERYTPDILEGISAGKYTLILDEAYAVTKTVTATQKSDFQCLLDNGAVRVDPETHHATLVDERCEGYGGTSMQDMIERVRAGSIYYFQGKVLIWIFPVHILQAFESIIVLTYMFEAQTLYPYLKLHGYQFNYWGTRKSVDGTYEFCPADTADTPNIDLYRLITPLDHEKMNAIGAPTKALCANWYDGERRKGGKSIVNLARHIRNAPKNIYKCSAKEFMWTTYQRFREEMQDKNIKPHFVPCNARASNQWRNKRYLAYCVNIYEHPDAADYFEMLGYPLDVDKLALSEMIQWIWRSAIRDGKEIWIYIPSSRMRGLLEDWIKEVSADANAAA